MCVVETLKSSIERLTGAAKLSPRELRSETPAQIGNEHGAVR